MGDLILGVFIIRILLFRVLYLDPLFLETPIWGCRVLASGWQNQMCPLAAEAPDNSPILLLLVLFLRFFLEV